MKTLRIKNTVPFPDQTFEFGQLNFIAGKNDTGKSTMLYAIVNDDIRGLGVVDWREAMPVSINIDTSTLKYVTARCYPWLNAMARINTIKSHLAAFKGTKVVLENPECFLHESRQFDIGFLAAEAAECGVQVFIESHSEHVFNGIRVAVKQGVIAPVNVAVFYLENEGQEHTNVHKIGIDSDGRVVNWPDRFFQQYSIELEQLM